MTDLTPCNLLGRICLAAGTHFGNRHLLRDCTVVWVLSWLLPWRKGHRLSPRGVHLWRWLLRRHSIELLLLLLLSLVELGIRLAWSRKEWRLSGLGRKLLRSRWLREVAIL